MIPAIILENNSQQRGNFESRLKKLCPYLKFPKMPGMGEALTMLKEETEPVMVFWDPASIKKHEEIDRSKNVFICVSDSYEYVDIAIEWRVAGYLLKPVEETKLVQAVECARAIIDERKTSREQTQLVKKLLLKKEKDSLIGIPTIEGAEILKADEIIRCEGLQKCTRIVTHSKKDIISAYNIGEFKKLLCPFGNFFSPHRSNLINMWYVRAFKKAGVIVMNDGSTVPITCENKKPFLTYITSI